MNESTHRTSVVMGNNKIACEDFSLSRRESAIKNEIEFKVNRFVH